MHAARGWRRCVLARCQLHAALCWCVACCAAALACAAVRRTTPRKHGCLTSCLPPCSSLGAAGFASAYIAVPGRKADEKGTGGSDFMPALTSYRDATARHMLS